MTLFQCRRFQFFDLQKVEMDINVKESIKDSEVICGTSGGGKIRIGDSDGTIHSICRKLNAITVTEAHDRSIIQMYQLKQSPYLFTLGEDEQGYSIKIWDESKTEPDTSRSQLLLKKTLKLSRPKAPSCFAIHENVNILAVGYTDGYLQLYRGEITRDRNIKPRALLIEGEHGDVTGLHFKSGTTSILFVSTINAVFSFDVTNKDREAKLFGDKSGCISNCSCYSEGSLEDHFILGRNDAVYCYTKDGKGPCYGFDGEKHMLYFFRGYLLIIARVSTESYSMTVFDCANKFVGFSSSLLAQKPIRVATSEWGCLFVMSSDGTLWRLKEKDLQTKMGIFYRKNHYDLAIKVAKNNNFDAQGMSEIFCQYGDHLYSKGDLDGAIRQYCKTVGKLEPSYVVRKYLDSSRVLNLLEYLEVIHKTGHATPDLTTLLLNCLTKLKLNDKIELYVKDPSCDFLEPETAIKVFRKGGMYKQAFQLAKKHNLYGSAFQILIEDVKDPCKEDLYDILEKTIADENVESILKRFGSSLVHLVGKTDSNKSIDTWKKIVRLLCECPSKRELVDLFIANKEILLPLLENICQEFQPNDGPLMNLLLEAYLDQWAGNKDSDLATREKILALMSKAPDCPSWDWSRALFTCKMFEFTTGEIIAYEKLGLHNDLLSIRYAAAVKNPVLWKHFIETCRKYAKNKPALWRDALFLITMAEEELSSEERKSKSECPQEVVEEILSKLLEENLMEPLPILDRLCQTNFRLGSVRKFLNTVLNRSDIEENESLSVKLLEETGVIRNHIETLRSKPAVFQSSRCNVCSQKLEFPSVHFLCMHSYHQHCFDSYAINEKDCPVCWNKDKETLGVESKPSKVAVDADFAVKLSTAKSNSFSVLADFVGKGIFKEEEEPPKPSLPQKKNIEKLRLSQAFAIDPMQSIPSEGRLRLQEGTVNAYLQHESQSRNHEYSSIESYLESVRPYQHIVPPNQSMQPSQSGGPSIPRSSAISSSLPRTDYKEIKRDTRPSSSLISQNITTAAPPKKSAAPKNPFEEEEDDINNPFKEPSEPKNPFEEDDDYDSSLNPFAE